VQIKAEYDQLFEIAAAFGAPLLGTALVVISGFNRLPGQRTRMGALSDHCRRIEVDYQSGSKQRRPKGFADLCTSLGKLLTQMRGMISEYERAQIAEISEDRSQLPFGERVDLE
jgi:hypothetical protein